MDNFTYQNPTKLIFGKDQLSELKNEISNMAIKSYLFMVGGALKRTACMTK